MTDIDNITRDALLKVLIHGYHPLEDVVTTGGSALEALKACRAEGFEVPQAIVLVDRQQGGLQRLQGEVEQVEALYTLDEIREAYRSA